MNLWTYEPQPNRDKSRKLAGVDAVLTESSWWVLKFTRNRLNRSIEHFTGNSGNSSRAREETTAHAFLHGGYMQIYNVRHDKIVTTVPAEKERKHRGTHTHTHTPGKSPYTTHPLYDPQCDYILLYQEPSMLNNYVSRQKSFPTGVA